MRLQPTVPLNWCAHRFKARFPLNPTLSFCTATSIKATASSFSAAAVVSISVSQRVSSRSISVEEYQNAAWALDSKLTLQSHPRNTLTQGPHEVFLKYFLRRLFLRLLGCINTWVFIVALFQISSDIDQELVIFSEHRDDGNFESDALQTITSAHDDSPFLSEYWQMSLKFFSSCSGRRSSIGMQYLKIYDHH